MEWVSCVCLCVFAVLMFMFVEYTNSITNEVSTSCSYTHFYTRLTCVGGEKTFIRTFIIAKDVNVLLLWGVIFCGVCFGMLVESQKNAVTTSATAHINDLCHTYKDVRALGLEIYWSHRFTADMPTSLF